MKSDNLSQKSVISLLEKRIMLLQKEYEFEKESFKQQSESSGILKQMRNGMCWFPISISKCFYNSLNQFIIEIEREEDKGRDHLFEYGRSVNFFTHTPQGNFKYFNISATVSYAEEDKMSIVLPGTEALATIQQSKRLGVQIYFDESIYKLMFSAMNNLIKANGNRLAMLRDKFYGNLPLEEFTFSPRRFPWLNSSQEEAVNKVLLAKDVAIMHGPPGTGKTTTFVEAIYETLQKENQVLVCAQSNMAVDWISEKLIERGISVLRIGNPNRINDNMLQYTYEHRFESHPDYPQLWSIRKAIRELHARMRNGKNDREKSKQKINSLKDRAIELEIRINNSLFSEARVIASTLTGSVNNILNGYKFGTLFIDEAAQALEAACWIAIQKADRVIMAGDYCQLPPTIKSIEAMKGGLSDTLMQQIINNKPECVSLLKRQYRMNEEIMRFSSEWFYHGKLEAAQEVKYRGILDFDTSIEWIDTSDDNDNNDIDFNENTTEGNGRINKNEALLSVEVIKEYINKIGKERIMDEHIDFGFISPYKAQVQYLRKLIKKDSFFKPYLRSITINTIDGFQGQERDVILISLVRSNKEGNIGFLNDLRRMNVAMTRAKMKLIILGNSQTLTKTHFYKELYNYINSLGY